MAGLKRINIDSGQFVANGITYYIEESVSTVRYAELQILEKEMAYGSTVKGIFDKLQMAYNDINKQKFADSAVKVNDIMRGVAKLNERKPVIMKICALFINTEDEDRAAWSVDQYNKKIADWDSEAFDVRDFFTLASNAAVGFLEIYNKVTRTISELIKEPEAGNQ